MTCACWQGRCDDCHCLYVWPVLVGREDVMTATVCMYDLCLLAGKTWWLPLYVWPVLVGREDVMTATVCMYDLCLLAGKTWYCHCLYVDLCLLAGKTWWLPLSVCMTCACWQGRCDDCHCLYVWPVLVGREDGLHWPVWPHCNGWGKTPLSVWPVLVGREDVMTATVCMYDLCLLAGKTWRWLLQSEQSTLRHHHLCLACMLWWSGNWRTTILCFPMTFLHQAKVSVWR